MGFVRERACSHRRVIVPIPYASLIDPGAAHDRGVFDAGRDSAAEPGTVPDHRAGIDLDDPARGATRPDPNSLPATGPAAAADPYSERHGPGSGAD